MILTSCLAAASVALVGAEGASTPTAAAEQGVSAYPPAFFAEASPVSAYDMVQRIPGFTFDGGVEVRGLAGAGGNVLIDGQPPVSKNDRLDEVLKRIPAASVARIELIRGGAPGIDMQGRSVMANVVRRSTSGFRGSVSPSITSIYDGRVNPSLRGEAQWRWDGRLVESSLVLGRGTDDWQGDGPRTRVGPNGEPRLLSYVDADSEGIRLWLTSAYEAPLGRGRLRLNAGHFWEPANVEFTDRFAIGPGREHQYQTNDRERSELGARFTRPLTEELSLEAVGFQQWTYRYTTDRLDGATLSRRFVQQRDTAESIGRGILRWRPTQSWNLEGGAEGAFNQFSSLTAFRQNGVDLVLPNARLNAEETRGEVFGLASWRPSAELTLEAGVRQERSAISSVADVSREKTLTFTKPRVAAIWAPSAARQVRLRLEREVGQLNFNDFAGSSSVVNTGTAVVGNPDLTPQQAWVSEIAFEQRFWEGGSAVLTLRHSEITDVVDRVVVVSRTGVVGDAPGNIGEGTKDEAVVGVTLPLDRLLIPAGLLKGQVAWVESEVVDPATGAPRDISAQRPVIWEAHFTQDLPHWRTTWGVDVTGGFRERFFRATEVETNKLGTWVVVFAEYKARPDLIVRFEVQNAAARGWRQIREVYVGSRGDGRLDYVNIRHLKFGPMLFLRVRKSFGG